MSVKPVIDSLWQEFRTAILGTVVHDDDLVVGISAKGFEDGWNIFLKQIAPVPVGNYHAGGSSVRPFIRWNIFLAQSGSEVHQRERGHRDRDQDRKKKD